MSQPLRLVPQAAQPIEFSCPLCLSTHAAYVFGNPQFRIYQCGGCALTFSKRRGLAATEIGSGIAEAGRKPARSEGQHTNLAAALKATTFSGPVLVIAESANSIIPLVQRGGTAIGRIVGHDDFGPADWGGTFNGAIVSETLMQVSDPQAALRKIRRHLTEQAPLILSMPLLDGTQARLMGRNWHEWQSSNLWYFTRETLSLFLLSAGFEHVWFQAERRRYSLDNLVERSELGKESLWLGAAKTLHLMSPRNVRSREFPLPSGTSIVTAHAKSKRPENVVSIIVPVYNEATTFQVMMDALLAKQLPGMRKEIVIVESNSTDGSREIVQRYAGYPDVRIVLQAKPQGKGNAVREGLKVATGDILMIQDADLEYDLDDYDGLLMPIVSWQSMFILGSRHQGGWKMRKFNDAPLTAAMFNLGHWFFKSLINFLLRTRMSDPFTMFKVFRRDALFGLELVCNRFDLDIELVMKLVRKGYVPVELPVNYVARSFAEGKKVSVSKDGLTWVWTILKLRFSAIGTGRA
ncbi:MAG: hypothetical protein QOJ96_2864 [Alphaproteobacteria bacterium]|jgi:hypothetical protein|nr:hypothetical protein [Alphaproteobacteria bacterium]